MGYIDSTLGTNEQVIYRGRLSTSMFVFYMVLGVILLPVIFGIFVILNAFTWYFTTELVVTNRKVIAKQGLIQRRTVEMLLPKVETIQVHQSILGRMFNYGSIVVSGAGNPQAPIGGIADPLEFRRQVLALVENPSTSVAPSATAVS